MAMDTRLAKSAVAFGTVPDVLGRDTGSSAGAQGLPPGHGEPERGVAAVIDVRDSQAARAAREIAFISRGVCPTGIRTVSIRSSA